MGAPDLLRSLREAGLVVEAVDGGGVRVRPAAALTQAHRQAIRDNRAELLSLLARSPDRSCWPHSDAMNGTEMELFAKRAQRFTRRGLSPEDAEATADRLVIRDREQDDRRTCLECAGWRRGRCGNYHRAGLHSAEIGSDLASMLQRCPGFAELADRTMGQHEAMKPPEDAS